MKSEGIQNLIIPVGRDSDLVTLIANKATRKGFHFSTGDLTQILNEQKRGDDMYMRIRLDFSGVTHHTGYGNYAVYKLNSGRPQWGGEECRMLSVFDLERVLTEFANRPQVTYVKLNHAYTAEIARDLKTVKVGCSTFDADKILLVADILRGKTNEK